MPARIAKPAKKNAFRQPGKNFAPRIRAVLFDCNGIIADDEPIHLKLFQKVLAEEGIPLTKEEYFEEYLAMDDRSCFRDALVSHNRDATPDVVQDLIERKAEYYQEVIKKELKIFPGVADFVKACAKTSILAVVSGALRHEIDLILKRAGIARHFAAIVSAENVSNGKPDPECYIKGMQMLNGLRQFQENPLKGPECLAVEDSIHGVDAAHKAGLRCLAVTNSYSKKELSRADAVVSTLKGLRLESIPLSPSSLNGNL